MPNVVVLTIILYLCAEPCYAYIDPATGSMALSVVIGILTTVLFLLQTLFHKFKFLLNKEHFKSKNAQNIPIAIYSEGKKYTCVFEDILDELEQRNAPAVFYTSSADDPLLAKNYKYIKTEYAGPPNTAYLKLAFLKADFCLLTTPGLDVYQLRRSKNTKHYCFIPHDFGDMCRYRMFSLDYFDSLLLVCDKNIEYIRQIEKAKNLKGKELVVTGSCQLDWLARRAQNSEDKSLKSEKFTVLFSPTWNNHSILNSFGKSILERLSKTNWKVIIRFHPQSYTKDAKIVKEIEEKYKNNPDFYFDRNPDNTPSLKAADVMISDFSAITYEFALLYNKPVICSAKNFNPELTDRIFFKGSTWFFDCLDLIGFEIDEKAAPNIVDIIKNIDTERIRENIDLIKNKYWKYQGNAAKMTVDYIMQKQKELGLKEND